MKIGKEALCKKLAAKFGIRAAVIDGAPTIGEDCVTKGAFEGLPVVEYYDGVEPLYVFGVLKAIVDFAKRYGWDASLYDPGTAKFYPE